MYKGIVRKRALWLKMLIVMLAFILLFVEILMKQYIYIPLALLVALAAFFEKEQIIDEIGIDIKYNIFDITTHNYWQWSEITTLHFDFKRATPNVIIHIGKDIVTRSFIMTVNDAQSVKLLAKEANPKIYIQDIL